MHWPAMDLEVAVTRIVAMVSERANLSVRHLMKHLLVAVANPSAKAMATACNSIEHVSVWLQACQRKTRRLGRSHRAHGYTRVHTGTHGYRAHGTVKSGGQGLALTSAVLMISASPAAHA